MNDIPTVSARRKQWHRIASNCPVVKSTCYSQWILDNVHTQITAPLRIWFSFPAKCQSKKMQSFLFFPVLAGNICAELKIKSLIMCVCVRK